jgi:hypothetical protein
MTRSEAFSLMDDVARFRRNAEDCRRHAQQMALNEHRDALLEMARQWDALAGRAEEWKKKHVEPDGSAEDDSSS